MPLDPENAFDASGGIDDWFVPGVPRSDTSFPDDWFVPATSATPNMGQRAPAPQPNVANPGIANPPAAPPDTFADYWSLIPASRAGAMAWQPPIFLPPDPFAPENIPASKWLTPLPIFLGDSPSFPTNNSTTSVWPSAPSPLVGGPSAAAPGGILGALAHLGSSSPAPGGLLGALAQLDSSSPAAGGSFPSPPQPQSANVRAVSPTGRRPIGDYSTDEIAGDAAKSFGVGMGNFAIHSAGFLGDAREMLANGAQRAADYLAPGSAPNAGSKVSEFLATYPWLAGPTSSQLQSAVESYTGPFYQPKTIVGDYAETAGEFVPGALFMPGGGLARSALRYGLLPALSSETAGQLTKGTAAEPWARIAGAILGAAPGAWHDLPLARSAPEVAETLTESKPSAAKNIPQVTLNKAAGDAWEAEGTDKILPKTQVNIQPQITVKSGGPSGLKVRLDAVGQDRTTGEIALSDMKASDTAPLTRNQTAVYPELETHGGVVVGKGKAPCVGGTPISPTQVSIIRRPRP
jgi:hypothetical protein